MPTSVKVRPIKNRPPLTDEQTPEERRIRAHYRSKRIHWMTWEDDLSSLFLYLARHWKRPVWEIRRIVKGHHIETD
jgi:hypothetical protein